MIDWIRRNADNISMFVAGWCALAAINDLINERYGWASLNIFLSVVNVWLATRRI